MRLIKSESHATGQVLFKLPKGNYAGLYVRWTGSNAAANTLDLAELGRIVITHQNREIVNVRPEYFIKRTNLYGGVPESSSAVGAAFAYSFIIPFRTKRDTNNILPVQPDSTEFSLKNYVADATVISGLIEIYALLSEGVAKYVPLIKELTMDFAGAATKTLAYGEEFIEELHIIHNAALSKIALTRDGASIIDGSWGAVDAFSDAQNRVETGIDLVEVLAQKSEFLQNVRETVITLTTTGAIAELVTTYFATGKYTG